MVPQSVTAPLTSAAIFLVAAVNPDLEHHATVRSFCGELAKLVRAVGFRDLDGGLSCIMGFGSDAWERLFGSDRPAELHTFREIRAGTRHAVATPGDLLFHIRAQRMDLCFELATQIMAQLAGAVSPLDEVHGFRYFDARDLLGFVDGTENPVGQEAVDAVLIGTEDAEFAGGSYVIVQKYLHDLAAWNSLSTEAQERMFVGRPPGNYDRLLDFSRAVTGTLFFMPSATFLESVIADEPAHEPAPSVTLISDGSLDIGAFKGNARHE